MCISLRHDYLFPLDCISCQRILFHTRVAETCAVYCAWSGWVHGACVNFFISFQKHWRLVFWRASHNFQPMVHHPSLLQTLLLKLASLPYLFFKSARLAMWSFTQSLIPKHNSSFIIHIVGFKLRPFGDSARALCLDGGVGGQGVDSIHPWVNSLGSLASCSCFASLCLSFSRPQPRHSCISLLIPMPQPKQGRGILLPFLILNLCTVHILRGKIFHVSRASHFSTMDKCCILCGLSF